MTLKKEIEKLYENPKPNHIHSYLRPIYILLCFIVGFYAFRVIVLDYVSGVNDIDVYAAQRQMEEGDFEKAEEILKQVLAKQPNLSVANERLGFLYLQQDRLEQALECYNKALLYSPDSETIENAILLINKRIND